MGKHDNSMTVPEKSAGTILCGLNLARLISESLSCVSLFTRRGFLKKSDNDIGKRRSARLVH
jgi:hypothetical protein